MAYYQIRAWKLKETLEIHASSRNITRKINDMYNQTRKNNDNITLEISGISKQQYNNYK